MSSFRHRFGAIFFALSIFASANGFAKPPIENHRVEISAGPDQVINFPATAQLRGSIRVAHEKHHQHDKRLTFSWSMDRGPGVVRFSQTSSLTTSARFSTSGVYELKLSAFHHKKLLATDTTTVTVNHLPIVSAGPDQVITLPNAATLSGTISDDGLPTPPGATVATWSLVNGPGEATFENTHAPATNVSFSATGTYILQLSANDGSGMASSRITIQVNVAPPSNLVYAQPTAIYTWGAPITPNTPSVAGGKVTLYSISPVLPQGLQFDTQTGVISGTPMQLSPPSTYEIIAMNSGGATKSSISIEVKDVPMSILLGIEDNLSTNVSSLEIPITVIAGSAVQISVLQNGIPVTQSNQSTFTAVVTLTEGANVFHITATDVPGSQVSADLTHIVLDTTGPVLSNLVPAQDAVLTSLTFAVSGTANEPLAYAKVNGVSLQLSQDQKAFSGTISSSTAGPMSLDWEASDLLGNVTRVATSAQIGTQVNWNDPGTLPPGDGVLIPQSSLQWCGYGYCWRNSPASMYPGGPTGSACEAARQVMPALTGATLPDANGNPTNVADPAFIESLANGQSSVDPEVLAYMVACGGVDFRPTFDCAHDRAYYKVLVGEYPEDTILSALQNTGVSPALISFLKPRFNVCTGLDLSGLGCKEMLQVAAAVSDLIVPGMGQVLGSPVAQGVAKALACRDLSCSDPLYEKAPVCWNIGLPAVPDVSVSVNLDLGDGPDCWFGCGGGGSGSGGWWFNFPPAGSGGSGTPLIECSALPSDVSQLTFGEILAMASQNNQPASLWVDSIMACASPSAVPGFPDLNAPVVTILGPTEGQVVQDTVVVTGLVGDYTSTVAVNGVAVATTFAGAGLQFSVTIPRPADGVITVRATDAAGNVGSGVVHVVYVPPVLPPVISYSPASYVFTVGQAVSIPAPSNSGGGVDTYSISPALPEGLTIDPITGVISGTPTVAAAGASYTVTGVNAGGMGVAVLTIVVNAAELPIFTISAGYEHVCASGPAGHAYCWGANTSGQLGSGSNSAQGTPVEALGIGASGYLSGITTIGAGQFHTCALAFGNAYCWGNSSKGQLGNSSNAYLTTEVVGIGGSGLLSNLTAIAGGYAHTCAVSSSGNSYCWGGNIYGGLGNGSTTDSRTPVQVLGVSGSTLSGLTSIDDGDYYSCAVSSSGNAYCWGRNTYGQLGNGSTADSSTPVQVVGVTESGYLSDVAKVSAGNSHACALSSAGYVYCWGYGGDGELGNGSTMYSSPHPVQVKGLGGIGYLSETVAISAGGNHTCALNKTGNVYCWGYNGSGQLGNNSFSQSTVPVKVLGIGGTSDLSNIQAISTGSRFSCAINSSGNVYCWGANNQKQLGNNSTQNSPVPVNVIGLPSL